LVVVDASSGIGRATPLRLARKAAAVTCAALREDAGSRPVADGHGRLNCAVRFGCNGEGGRRPPTHAGGAAMTDMTPEVVPPSDEPNAAVATGSGHQPGGATPPRDSSEVAGTGGVGTVADQQGSSAQGGAAYSLDGDENPTQPQSPSGT
jgi:hypothetical protein